MFSGKIFEHKKDNYILFPSSEIFITFKIFCVLISFLFLTKVCLKEFRYGASGPGCSKIFIFCRTEAGLTSKWGRISPAIYWGHQSQSTYIEGCRETSRDVSGKLADHAHIHTISHMETACCLRIYNFLPIL